MSGPRAGAGLQTWVQGRRTLLELPPPRLVGLLPCPLPAPGAPPTFPEPPTPASPAPQACHTAQQMLAPRGPWLRPAGWPHPAGPAPLCLTAVGTGRPPRSRTGPSLGASPCVSGSVLPLSSQLSRAAWLPSGLEGKPCPGPGAVAACFPPLLPTAPPPHVTWDPQDILAEKFPRMPLAGGARLSPISLVGWGSTRLCPVHPRATVSGDGVLLVALMAGAWDPARVPVSGILL